VSPLTPAPEGYPIKIVRDNTPEIINQSGESGDLFYGKRNELSVGDRAPWLQRKLVEEVAEYIVAPGVQELRDVLAVIEGLTLVHGVSLASLLISNHLDERGGFLEGRMMYGYHAEFDGSLQAGDKP